MGPNGWGPNGGGSTGMGPNGWGSTGMGPTSGDLMVGDLLVWDLMVGDLMVGDLMGGSTGMGPNGWGSIGMGPISGNLMVGDLLVWDLMVGDLLIMNTEDMNKEDAKYVISDFLTKKDEELKYLDRSEITLYVSLLNQNISSLKNDIPVFRDFVYHFLRLLCLNGETVDIMKNDQVETVLIELIIRYMNEDLQKVQDCKRIDCLTLLAHSIEKLQYFDVTILQAEEESERRRNTRAELENRVVPLFSVAIKSENISQKDLSAILETLLVVILQIAIKGGIFKSSNISLDIQALQGCLQIDNDKIRNLSTYLLLYSGENITVKKEDDVLSHILEWLNEAYFSKSKLYRDRFRCTDLMSAIDFIATFPQIKLKEQAKKLPVRPNILRRTLTSCYLVKLEKEKAQQETQYWIKRFLHRQTPLLLKLIN
ncbi:hypothetical protein Btru_048098 [Bulinus truncatus]|nr:hypothetical protein Btru_048098 [Bulinus truncatus]